MNEPRSFYLPSPDEFYKDLCRDMQSDLYDMYWHETKANPRALLGVAATDSVDASTQSGTLHSWSATTGSAPPVAFSGPRIIQLAYSPCEDAPPINFTEWYETVVESCCGEKFINDGPNCYIIFETADDAALVCDYLQNVARDDSISVSLLYSLPQCGWTESVSSSSSSSVVATVPEKPSWVASPAAVDQSKGSGPPAAAAACGSGRIIHVVMSYSTCMDRVIDDFSRFGKMCKIIMFTKDTTVQALIEYETLESAQSAVESCCVVSGVSIQFSRLSVLSIQQNNNRAWDFTLEPHRENNASGKAANSCGSPLSLISIGFNEIFSMKKLPKELKDWLKTLEKFTSNGQTVGSGNIYGLGNVIIVYNISCDNVDEIFNIFSIYGICSRVKILRQKNQCILIQYSDPVYSSFAKYFLNRVPFWNPPGLQISFSKIDHVKISAGEDGAELSRVYSQSDQRFCEVYKYGNCVCFPSETIFIASISDQTPKSQLIKLVSSIGKPVAHAIRLPYPGGPKKTHMLVQYQDTPTALKAIAKLHNTVLHGSQIKIAFSKVKLTR